jgi:hypothetical protein
MTDSTHEELDRHAERARERLLATLDVLDHRARGLVQNAAETTRATMIGVAGAMALSVGLVLAQRASRRIKRRTRDRDADKPSLIGDAFRVGAVALVFVGLSAWAKRAAHVNGTSPPQPSQNAPPLPTRLGPPSLATDDSAALEQAGTTHASNMADTIPHDAEGWNHD